MTDGPRYLIATGRCFICGNAFTFNPHLVPSVPIGDDGQPIVGGTRRPICRDCAEPINAERARRGLATWEVSDRAYGASDDA